jgi:hypothetical protein
VTSCNAKKMSGLLVVLMLSLGACGDDKNPTSGGGDEVEVPSAYVFDSRFSQGESSVSYGGQVVRNLLIQDLKTFIDRLGQSGAQAIEVEDLLHFYEHDDGLDLESLSEAGAKVIAEKRYSSISTGKNLVDKVSSEPVIGYGLEADTLLRQWFAIIAANSRDADKLGTPAVYTSAEGVDLAQMVHKVLTGALAYHQSTGVYLAGLLERDNSQARGEGEAATDMEHAWDEAFGYFGAARDYAHYSDAELAGGGDDYTSDADGDGMIDFRSEYNFGLSRNAGKRDLGGSGVDFSGEIFAAFLRGRAWIADQGTINEISAQRQLVAEGMEKVIAATVVHYINDTLSDMADLGTADENRTGLNKHWAEMKGFTVALQYNPFRLIGAAQLDELHAGMGRTPLYAAPGSVEYEERVADLIQAKQVLRQVYGFSDTNMAGW